MDSGGRLGLNAEVLGDAPEKIPLGLLNLDEAVELLLAVRHLRLGLLDYAVHALQGRVDLGLQPGQLVFGSLFRGELGVVDCEELLGETGGRGYGPDEGSAVAWGELLDTGLDALDGVRREADSVCE